jgi:hypothetical protein
MAYIEFKINFNFIIKKNKALSFNIKELIK